MANLESKIGRVQTNIANAIAAVAEKGVGVSASANSDDLPGLIRQISQAEDLDAELDAQESKLAELLSILDGKAAGGGDSNPDPELPAGYRRVNYIRFTGEQEVDTAIVPNQDTTIKIWFTRESSDAQYLYGVVSDGNTASVTAYLSSGGSWRFGAKSTSRNVGVDADIIHTAIVSKAGIKHESGTNAFSGVTDFTAVGTLIVGGVRNASGTVAAAQFVGKILAFEMWQGDDMALKWIPAVDADGVYHFWDTVEQTFAEELTDIPLEGGNL